MAVTCGCSEFLTALGRSVTSLLVQPFGFFSRRRVFSLSMRFWNAGCSGGSVPKNTVSFSGSKHFMRNSDFPENAGPRMKLILTDMFSSHIVRALNVAVV